MSGRRATHRGDAPDLLSAALFAGLGTLGLVMSGSLEAGSLSRMGPGFLPRVVCWLLVAVGVGVGLSALRRPAQRIEAARLRPLAVIILSIVGFAYAVAHLGFVLASLWLIIAGSLADPGGRWRRMLLLSVGLTVFGALVFVVGLGVQVPLWPI